MALVLSFEQQYLQLSYWFLRVATTQGTFLGFPSVGVVKPTVKRKSCSREKDLRSDACGPKNPDYTELYPHGVWCDGTLEKGKVWCNDRIDVNSK